MSTRDTPSGSKTTTSSPCGCSSNETIGEASADADANKDAASAADEPLVCREMPSRLDEFRAILAKPLLAAERFPGGFRWVFRAEPGLEARLRDLAGREHECCAFFDVRVTAQGDRIIWETTGDDHTAAALDEYFHLPQTLRQEGKDALVAVRRRGEQAGVQFTDPD